jgi:hypothetical protein
MDFVSRTKRRLVAERQHGQRGISDAGVQIPNQEEWTIVAPALDPVGHERETLFRVPLRTGGSK